MVPERGKRSENGVETTPRSEQRRHVLHDDDVGSKVANAVGEGEPKGATGAFAEPFLLSGIGNVLTGETSREDVRSRNVERRAHVGEDGNRRPTRVQYARAVGIGLDEPRGTKAARPLKADLDAADAGEQTADGDRGSFHSEVGIIAGREDARSRGRRNGTAAVMPKDGVDMSRHDFNGSRRVGHGLHYRRPVNCKVFKQPHK